MLKVAMAQIAPVWLDKEATIEKVKESINEAASQGCELIVFGEGLLPGYPFWIGLTNGAEFDSKVQKELHAHYIRNAITIEEGELDAICDLAKEYSIAIYLGIIEVASHYMVEKQKWIVVVVGEEERTRNMMDPDYLFHLNCQSIHNVLNV